MAGCSDLGCKVDVVDQQASGCPMCSIAKKRKIRRRLQSSNEVTGSASEIKFKITATSLDGLDLTQVNQRLETVNLASLNDKLNEARFWFIAVETTPQTDTLTTSTVSHFSENQY